MKIRIAAVGRLKSDGGFEEMSCFYRNRIKPFCDLEVVETREKKDRASETAELQRLTLRNSFIVALREEGDRMDTKQFARMIEAVRLEGRPITFIIGGAYGFDNAGESRSISIAPWTLNHQLARLVLLEQIYRAFSLLNGGSYHHD